VESYGIPALTLSFRRFRREHGHQPDWRAKYNAGLLRLLDAHPVDLLVLAGFMLILDESVVRAHPILNLHPAAPGGPVGAWQDVMWELIATRARETGVLTQLATSDLDRGPIVTYCTFPIRGPDFGPLWAAVAGVPIERLKATEGEDNALFKAIRQAEVEREAPLLVETLKAIAQGRVRLEDGRVLDAQGRPLPGGLDLSDEIEALVRAGA
jgi:folate-dependent phosphoribosylglycinamide formyltransferase PurN